MESHNYRKAMVCVLMHQAMSVSKCLHYENSQEFWNRATDNIEFQLICQLKSIQYSYFNTVICYLKDIKHGIFLYVHVHNFLFSSVSVLMYCLYDEVLSVPGRIFKNLVGFFQVQFSTNK